MLASFAESAATWRIWALRRLMELLVFSFFFILKNMFEGGSVLGYDLYALKVLLAVVLYYWFVLAYVPIQAVLFFFMKRRSVRLQAFSESGLFLLHSGIVMFLAGIDLFGALARESRITPVVAGWFAVVALHAMFIAWRLRWRSTS